LFSSRWTSLNSLRRSCRTASSTAVCLGLLFKTNAQRTALPDRQTRPRGLCPEQTPAILFDTDSQAPSPAVRLERQVGRISVGHTNQRRDGSIAGTSSAIAARRKSANPPQPTLTRRRRKQRDCGCLEMMRVSLAGSSAGTSPVSGRFVIVYQLPTIIAADFRPCNTLFPSFGDNSLPRVRKIPNNGLWPSNRPRTGFAPVEQKSGIARGPSYDRMSPAFKAASSPGQRSAIRRKRSSCRPRHIIVRLAVEYVLSTLLCSAVSRTPGLLVSPGALPNSRVLMPRLATARRIPAQQPRRTNPPPQSLYRVAARQPDRGHRIRFAETLPRCVASAMRYGDAAAVAVFEISSLRLRVGFRRAEIAAVNLPRKPFGRQHWPTNQRADTQRRPLTHREEAS